MNREILVFHAGKKEQGPLAPGAWMNLSWPVDATLDS